MKPFIYNFLERPQNLSPDISNMIEYSDELNLSVVKGTNQPAIDISDFSTTTMTKSGHEGTDSDNDNIFTKGVLSMGTMTQTREMLEGTDSDYNKSIKMLMDTSTITLVDLEATDSDRDNPIRYAMSTRTLTETKECTDSDK